jgi:hypothetical protein
MAYIGNTLRTAQPNYQIIDDISASFNGSTTTFALQVGGVTPAPFPVSAQHCLISVGGVIQQPDPTGTDGFLLSGSNIVFSAAPSFGEDFFGVVLAGADYINVGANFPDGSVATPSITFDQDTNTGLYRKGANNIGITTNGIERVSVGTSEVVFNDGGNDIDFRVEGDTESNLFFVDAGNDRVGIGTAAAQHSLSLLQGNALGWVSGAGNAKQKIEATGSDGLDFYTGSTPTLKATLDSSGRLLAGTSSTTQAARAIFEGNNSSNAGVIRLACANSSPASNEVIGSLVYAGDDHDNVADIYVARDGGTWTQGSSQPTRLVFSTTADGASSPTERMRIAENGEILIGRTASGITTEGHHFRSTGAFNHTRDSATIGEINRIGNDGTLINFRQASNVEGSISVSGSTVSYNGAHLSRWSQLASGAERTEILRGSVLSNLDEMCEWGDEDNEQLNRMKVSDVEGDPNVSGVFQSWDDDDDTYTNDFYCAMTGDFIIRIAQGTTVQRGDLLMSAGDGTAKPQDDDIIRSKTIAKVTSTSVSCTYDDGSYCVPCVLMAC